MDKHSTLTNHESLTQQTILSFVPRQQTEDILARKVAPLISTSNHHQISLQNPHNKLSSLLSTAPQGPAAAAIASRKHYPCKMRPRPGRQNATFIVPAHNATRLPPSCPPFREASSSSAAVASAPCALPASPWRSPTHRRTLSSCARDSLSLPPPPSPPRPRPPPIERSPNPSQNHEQHRPR